jgi:hypothetical protein
VVQSPDAPLVRPQFPTIRLGQGSSE